MHLDTLSLENLDGNPGLSSTHAGCVPSGRALPLPPPWQGVASCLADLPGLWALGRPVEGQSIGWVFSYRGLLSPEVIRLGSGVPWDFCQMRICPTVPAWNIVSHPGKFPLVLHGPVQHPAVGSAIFCVCICSILATVLASGEAAVSKTDKVPGCGQLITWWRSWAMSK